MAVACSSRWARATGATALTADAPQIIVPAASRSTIGRRRFTAAPRACATKKALGRATRATAATRRSSDRAKKLVCTLKPIRMMARRRTHLPVKRSPGA